MQADIKYHLITASAFVCAGFLISLYLHDYTSELRNQNQELRQINMQLIRDNDTLRYCVPKSGGKAVMTFVSGRLFCEVHNVARKS